MNETLTVVSGFLLAFVLASLVEWVVHLLMHRRILLGGVHYKHHATGMADGMIWEFLYYVPAAVIGSAIFLYCGYVYDTWWFAGGMTAGAFVYAFFAGYAHQIQHEHPELVFWMNPPVHTVHHKYELYRRNFGIGVDVWDKVFGTYQRVEWSPNPERRRTSIRQFWQIQWY